jgi:hypothetical protein
VARGLARDTGPVGQILESAEGGTVVPDTIRRFTLNLMGKRVER